MQVKKFEANSMKEALEMIKKEMGPEAIILSVRDNKKSYGLVGEGSVEITAAVSEKVLQQKKFTESRMPEPIKQQFYQSPAKQQKETISKMVSKYTQSIESSNPVSPKPVLTTNRKYIEIDDEVAAPAIAVSSKNQSTSNSSDLQNLKNEIESLKNIINQFQKMPQDFKQLSYYPGSEYGLVHDFSYMYEKLVHSGIATDIAAEILEFAQESLPPSKRKNRALIDGWVARYILDSVDVLESPIQNRIHCFLGPAGSGKTNSLIKFASHLLVRENKKIALVTTDTFKVGAVDQIKIYSQILNLPLVIIRQNTDWNTLVNYIAKLDMVLVDFPGLSLKNPEEINLLKKLMPPTSLKPHLHLVLSTSMKDADMTLIAKKYSLFNFQSAIFNGLDETHQHGNIYNLIKRFKVPLHSFGLGAKIPEDYEFATKERVLDLIFKITQNQKKELVA